MEDIETAQVWSDSGQRLSAAPPMTSTCGTCDSEITGEHYDARHDDGHETDYHVACCPECNADGRNAALAALEILAVRRSDAEALVSSLAGPERKIITRALKSGASWADIGRATGKNRATVFKQYQRNKV